MTPFDAALKGAQEIGFTVLSISVSLVAVFIPLLLMSGIVGRLFREFAVTMTIAIVISMAISLTGTPMMCAYLLKKDERHGRLYQMSERAFQASSTPISWTLERALDLRADHAARAARRHRPERLPVHPRAEGILPAAGHGPRWPDRSRPIRTPLFRR